MTSLFQTATGAWHWPSILAVLGWLVGSSVTGCFLFATLRVNRDDRLKASAKEQAAKTAAEEAARRIADAESQLAKAQTDLVGANERVTKLEQQTKPKPYKERLMQVLVSLDKRIPDAIRSGTLVFEGDLNDWNRNELMKIAGETGAEKYISVRAGDTAVSPDGISGHVTITLTEAMK